MLYMRGSADPRIIECPKCGGDAWKNGPYGPRESHLVRYECSICRRYMVYTSGKVPVVTVTRIPRTPGGSNVV